MDEMKLRSIDINISDYLFQECEDYYKATPEKSHGIKKGNVPPIHEQQSKKSLFKNEMIESPHPIYPQENLEQSPSLESSRGILSRSNPSIDQIVRVSEFKLEKTFSEAQQQAYNTILSLYEAEDVKLPFFFYDEPRSSISQLKCFELKSKKIKSVRYNESKMTCEPVFMCFGCQKQFPNSHSLGGHLSKCIDKRKHFREIQMIKKKSQICEVKTNQRDFGLRKRVAQRQTYPTMDEISKFDEIKPKKRNIIIKDRSQQA